MSTVLGIDIGTTSIAVLAYDTQEQKVLHTDTAANDATVESLPGRAEQDPQQIWRIVRRLVDRVLTAVGGTAIGAICAGQMHGAMLVDEAIRPLTPLVTWQDARTTDMVAELRSRLSGCGSSYRGCDIHPGYMGATLAWYVRQGALPVKTAHACFIADYITARLRGVESAEELVTDPSLAASSGLFDLQRGTWSSEALDALRIPASIMPQIRPSGERLGPACGPDRTVIGAPLGDNQASVLGCAGVDAPSGTCVINIGTGSQVSIVLDQGIPDPPAGDIEIRPYPGSRLLFVGASLNGGAAYALLRRFFAGAGRPGDVYQWMNEQASSVPPGCDGLVCVPRFHGERGSEDVRGELHSITETNLTPAHVCRAALEGMARSLRDLRDHAGVAVTRLVGSGNGIKRNPVLQRILRDTFGEELVLSHHDEEACLGAALLAAQMMKGA